MSTQFQYPRVKSYPTITAYFIYTITGTIKYNVTGCQLLECNAVRSSFNGLVLNFFVVEERRQIKAELKDPKLKLNKAYTFRHEI